MNVKEGGEDVAKDLLQQPFLHAEVMVVKELRFGIDLETRSKFTERYCTVNVCPIRRRQIVASV